MPALVIIGLCVLILLAVGNLVHSLMGLCFFLPGQGKVIGVLKDTSWITEDRTVFYLKDRMLCSIKLSGNDPKVLYRGPADYYALSSDNRYAAIWDVGSRSGEEAPPVHNIFILDLKTGLVESVEEKADCKWPSWVPNSAKIFYEYGDDHYLRIYDVAAKTRMVLQEKQRVSETVASADGSKIYYSSLFDKSAYEVDVHTGARIRLERFQKSKGPVLNDHVPAERIYRGISAGNDIRHWKVGSPSLRQTAYNKDGSLWLKTGATEVRLVLYTGVHDSKFAPGVTPVSWSKDEKYLVSDFDGIYITDIAQKKTGFLAQGQSARIVD